MRQERTVQASIFDLFATHEPSMLKILSWDRNGLCLSTKRLKQRSFVWPVMAGFDAFFALTPAQLAMLTLTGALPSVSGDQRSLHAASYEERSCQHVLIHHKLGACVRFSAHSISMIFRFFFFAEGLGAWGRLFGAAPCNDRRCSRKRAVLASLAFRSASVANFDSLSALSMRSLSWCLPVKGLLRCFAQEFRIRIKVPPSVPKRRLLDRLDNIAGLGGVIASVHAVLSDLGHPRRGC
ncbi:IS66 family insertion sequence element accessory protein TnpB [Mesorhizobium sp. ORM6]